MTKVDGNHPLKYGNDGNICTKHHSGADSGHRPPRTAGPHVGPEAHPQLVG